ncbi:MAG: MATE family efflux transporter [Salinigranum sp.]
MKNPLRLLFRWIARRLARLGVVDEERGRRTADLSWPRIVTGFARLTQRTADVAMVGLFLGPQAIAGMALGSILYELSNSLALGVAGGVISQTSQRFGAGRVDELGTAFKQGLLVSAAIAVPFSVVFWTFPRQLVGLFGVDPTTLGYGATYLQFLALGILPNFWNIASGRMLAGTDNTRIPMWIRATAASMNVVFNAVLIFGLGLGVAGAALGTVLADLFATACFARGFTTGRVPAVGAFPVRVDLSPPYFDAGLCRALLRLSIPLMLRRIAQSASKLPLYAVLAAFGPVVIAAYEIARRLQRQMNAPSWGFSVSASSLVGQHLGGGDESEAENYAWDIIRFSTVVYAVSAAFLVAFAAPLAHLFVRDPRAIAGTVPFVRAAGIALLASGIERTVTGVLQGTGDTTWPFYGQVVGLYLFSIPIAYLGTVTALGRTALYLSLVAETGVPALIVLYRFHSGRWREISRSFRPTPADD